MSPAQETSDPVFKKKVTVKLFKKSRQFSYKQLLIFGIIFAALGTYLIFFTHAATITLATIEAETMTTVAGTTPVATAVADSTASGGSANILYNNGAITGSFPITQAATSLTVRAKGTQCSGAPQMVVSVDGAQVLTSSVSSTSWADYPAGINLAPGTHNLSISFNNDFAYGGSGKKNRGRCDRNLYLDKTTIFGTQSDTQTGTNLALNKPTAASSIEGPGYETANAVDGNSSTRWASAGGVDPQWLYVDLGSTQNITQVKLNWEVAYAKSYQIQVSNDAVNWTTINSTAASDGGIDDITGLSASGRFVRVLGTSRATIWGYSIWDLEVYGSTGGTVTPPPTTTPPPTNDAAWTNILNDQFSQLSSVPSHWDPYQASWASSGHSPMVYYSPSHCSVSGGALHLLMKFEPRGIDGNSAPSWYTCTLSHNGSGESASPDVRVTLNWRLVSTNGGRAHHNMPLRWPNNECWPQDGEEDWFEGESANFTAAQPEVFMHYGTGCSGGNHPSITHQYNPIDLTQWHTYRFQRRTSGSNVEAATYIDNMNTPVWTCNSTTNPACNTTTMPATIMHTVLQQEVPWGACPDVNDPRYTSSGCPITGGDPSYYDGTSDFQVQWITIDKPL